MEKNQSNEKKADEVGIFHRPEKLEAKIVRGMSHHGKWIACIGFMGDKPVEIFAGSAEDFWIPQWVKKGWIIKTRPDGVSSRYDFQFKDKGGFFITIEALSRSFDRECWRYAKLVSRILRCDVPLPLVVLFISKIFDETNAVTLWKSAVMLALASFIPDGTSVFLSCPLCKKKKAIIYKDGCQVCSNCGYTRQGVFD